MSPCWRWSAVFALVGLIVVATGIWSFETWAWRWAHLAVVLVIGFARQHGRRVRRG